MRKRITDSGYLRAFAPTAATNAETRCATHPIAGLPKCAILSVLRSINKRECPPLSVLFQEAGYATGEKRGTVRPDRRRLDTLNGVCSSGMCGRIYPPDHGQPKRLGHDGNLHRRRLCLVVHSPPGWLDSVNNRVLSYPLLFIPQCTVAQTRWPRLFNSPSKVTRQVLAIANTHRMRNEGPPVPYEGGGSGFG